MNKKKYTFVDGYLKGQNPSNEGGATVCLDDNCVSYNIKQEGLTNNQVEIIACIIGMLEKRTTIISDSQIAVNCLNGDWKSHEEFLQPLVNLGRIILKLKKKKLVWERRDTNLAGIYNEKNYEKNELKMF